MLRRNVETSIVTGLVAPGAFTITQLPAANAGVITIVAANSGPFQGTIAPITP